MSEVIEAPVPEVPAESAIAQNETAQAPVEAEKPPEEVKEETTPEAKPVNRKVEISARKVDRLYRKVAEEKARADFLEKQIAELKPQQRPSGAPKLEEFSDIETYAKAFAEYEKTNAIKEYEQKQQTQAQQAAQQRLLEGWESRVKKAEESYEDFDEAVGDLKPTTPWAMAIMQAENGPDVAYHLGKNIKEARRIAALDPVSQIFEVGFLAATLASKPKEPKTASKAPAPITPVAGTAAPESGIVDGMDMKSFIRVRNKQLGR